MIIYYINKIRLYWSKFNTQLLHLPQCEAIGGLMILQVLQILLVNIGGKEIPPRSSDFFLL